MCNYYDRVAQSVRAPVLWAGGRGFKPRRDYAPLAQLVERKTFNLVAVGSSPTEGKGCFNIYLFLYMAWLAEWLRRQT